MPQNNAMKAFNRIFTIGLFLSALLFLSVPQKRALGVTVLGNYSLGENGYSFTTEARLRKAMLFEVPAGNDYQLNSFLARVSSEGLVTHQVSLYEASGTTRGAFVASLGTQSINTGSTGIYTDSVFTPASPVTLEAGQRYWIELHATADGPVSGWVGGATPTGIFTYVSYRVSIDSGGTWSSSSVPNIFTLDADEILPATATPTNTPTDTTVPPTATPTDTPTNTPVPPTATPTNTPTDTTVPSTATPTNTPTDTPVPPTATPTNTPTDTPVPPTATPTNTPTDTPVPPTATPTNTATSIPPTATPTLPFCVYGLPPNGVQGRVLIDVMAFYNPSLEATTNILVQGGSSWWIIDARNGFYKLWISCEGQPIWVLANTVAPNFDNVWNGAELPIAGE